MVEVLVFGVLVPAILILALGREVVSVRRAWLFAAEKQVQDLRILGACKSRGFGIRTGFPIVVVEIGAVTSRFVTFVGRHSHAETVPTGELLLKWVGDSLVRVEHPESRTKLWPRLNPSHPGLVLEPGQSRIPGPG